MIRRLSSERGTTIFLCTHQLRYAQEICTRYGLMDQGRLLAEGSLDSLRARIGSGIRVKMKIGGISMPSPAVQTGRDTWEISLKGEEEIPVLIRRAVEAGGSIYSVLPELPTLEDIYFQLTGRENFQTCHDGGEKPAERRKG